jgi:hypothetical protein
VASIVGFISSTGALQSSRGKVAPASLGKRGVSAKQGVHPEATRTHCVHLPGNDRHGIYEVRARLQTVHLASRGFRHGSRPQYGTAMTRHLLKRGPGVNPIPLTD